MHFSMPEDIDINEGIARQKKCSFYPCICCSYTIPQRIILVLFLNFGITAISYLRYSSMNIVIMAAASIPELKARMSNSSEACVLPGNAAFYENPKLGVDLLTDELSQKLKVKWPEGEIRIFLTYSYVWGYAIGHIHGMILADKYGGKFLMVACSSSGALVHLLYPTFLNGHKWYVYSLMDGLKGFLVGPMLPIASTMLVNWAPTQERATLGCIVFAGFEEGRMLSYIAQAVFLQYCDNFWQGPFIFLGLITIVWAVLFTYYCSTDPREHSLITRKELKLIQGSYEQESVLSRKQKSTPYLQILINRAALVLILCYGIFHFTNVLYEYMTHRYLMRLMKFHPATFNFMLFWHLVLHIMGNVLSGWFADYMVRKKIVRFENSRRYITCISILYVAVFHFFFIFAGCNHMLVFVAYIFLGFGLGINGNMLKVNMLDLSRNYVGAVLAITEGLANILGSLLGLAVYTNEMMKVKDFQNVYWGSFALNLFSAICIFMFSTTREQTFNTYISKRDKMKQIPTYPARY